MNKVWKIIIIVALVAAVAVVITYKKQCGCSDCSGSGDQSQVRDDLPTLVYIGSNCATCQQLKPMIKDLREEFAGRLNVVTPDTDADGVYEKYKWTVKPFFIFYDATGKEEARVGGVQSRDDIIEIFTGCGIDLTGKRKADTPTTRG